MISLCDRVREVCPWFPGTPRASHWSIPDPAREPGPDEETLPAFERTAAELNPESASCCSPVGRQILLDDPAGNPIELFQPAA